MVQNKKAKLSIRMKSNKNRSGAKRSLCKSSSDSNNFDDYDDYGTRKKYLCCGRVCTKSFLIIFNLLFMVWNPALVNRENSEYRHILMWFKIAGGFLAFFGAWTITAKHEYIELFDSSLYKSSTYMLISVGGLIILTGLLGIIGAWFDSKKILVTVSLSANLTIQISLHSFEIELSLTRNSTSFFWFSCLPWKSAHWSWPLLIELR